MDKRLTLLHLAVTEGLSNSEVAELVHLSRHTVDRYIKEAINNLGGRNRAHAVAIAYRTGVFEADAGAVRGRIADELYELSEKIRNG